MSTRAQLSPQILQQAAGWFGKFRTIDVPLSVRAEFFSWLKQSPQHVQAYLEEALAHSDSTPLTMCSRLISGVEEPCSDTRAPGVDDKKRR